MSPSAPKDLDEERLQQLREWVEKQPHLPRVPDKLLARMLHSCYGSMESTKTALDNYLTITTHAPDIFSNRAALDKRFQTQMEVIYVAPLEQRTKEGYRPVLVKFQDTDPAKFDMVSVVHTGLIIFCQVMDEDDRIPGYVVMFDFTGVTMSHIMKVSLTCLKQLLVFVQEGLPVRLKGIHFINSVPLVQQIVNLIKPLMKRELIEIFRVHTVDDMPNFYETYVAKEIMPKEYGGSAPSCCDLHGDLRKRIEANRDYLRELDGLLVDEKKRPGKSKDSSDIFGIQGSFKKLDLD